jgi:hypothetical protein
MVSHTLDLKTKVPFWDMPEEKRGEIWDDGLHFTPRGYDLIGRIIADRILELIVAESGGLNSHPANTSPNKVQIPWDDKAGQTHICKKDKPIKGELKKRVGPGDALVLARHEDKALRSEIAAEGC